MTRPFVIGVAGGTGSGKTTVVKRIMEALGDTDVTVLAHDRYYLDHPNLRLEERGGLNYDHPNSLDTDLFVGHVRALREGRPRTCRSTTSRGTCESQRRCPCTRVQQSSSKAF